MICIVSNPKDNGEIQIAPVFYIHIHVWNIQHPISRVNAQAESHSRTWWPQNKTLLKRAKIPLQRSRIIHTNLPVNSKNLTFERSRNSRRARAPLFPSVFIRCNKSSCITLYRVASRRSDARITYIYRHTYGLVFVCFPRANERIMPLARTGGKCREGPYTKNCKLFSSVPGRNPSSPVLRKRPRVSRQRGYGDSSRHVLMFHGWNKKFHT